MHAAFRGPCSKPTLVLLAAILFSGAMAGLTLYTRLLVASTISGLSSPEFVVQEDYNPELKLIFISFVTAGISAFVAAFSYWLG